ncbi:hypothetical protein SAMN05444921_105121 [Streptomyces wuyuanensis]|uniref:Uncharacterized protein n=1 Tax=Streptomyces wuyuanensis TaxID=1196353 RepID=A0A1G9RC95_9ACTN|nr:hypothetical protein SAMN05444921_105121 [Streptomyces wuyuanensis]
MPGACGHPGPPSAEWWRGGPAGGRKSRPAGGHGHGPTEAKHRPTHRLPDRSGGRRRPAVTARLWPGPSGPYRAGRARSRRGPTGGGPHRRGPAARSAPAPKRARSEECSRTEEASPAVAAPDRPHQTGPYRTGRTGRRPYRTGRTGRRPCRRGPYRTVAMPGTRSPAARSRFAAPRLSAGRGRRPDPVEGAGRSPVDKGFRGHPGRAHRIGPKPSHSPLRIAACLASRARRSPTSPGWHVWS